MKPIFEQMVQNLKEVLESKKELSALKVNPIDTSGLGSTLSKTFKKGTIGSPAVSLMAFRQRAKMTQKNLTKHLGVSRQHIGKMENAKRPITKDVAKKLGELFKVSYRVFFQM